MDDHLVCVGGRSDIESEEDGLSYFGEVSFG